MSAKKCPAGTTVKVTMGPHKGDTGTVVSMNGASREVCLDGDDPHDTWSIGAKALEPHERPRSVLHLNNLIDEAEEDADKAIRCVKAAERLAAERVRELRALQLERAEVQLAAIERGMA